MTSKKHRAIAFFAGIIICILAIECALRIVGAIYAHRSVTDQGTRNPSQYTILCVGDSVTFGIGAPRTQSYPAQLERLLNAEESKRTYAVINRGRPGQNTAQLLETLEGDIREVEPDIVTVLTGGANQANYYGYRKHEEEGKFLPWMHDQLYRIRLYKLVKLLCLNIRSITQHKGPNKHESIQALELDEETRDLSEESIATALETGNNKIYCAIGRSYMEKGDHDQALQFLLFGIQANVSNLACYSSIGDIFRERGQYDVALTWYQKGISIDPTFFHNYMGMGLLNIGQRQYEQALSWFKKALEVSQSDTLDPYCYQWITHVFHSLCRYREAVEFFRKEKKRNALANDYLLMFKKRHIENEVRQWVQEDVERTISLCEKHNIRIILQGYPDYRRTELVNYVVKDLANERGIPFVDHTSIFSRILKEGASREQYFVPDEHPNARGYGVMATNIYNTLQESNVLRFLKNP